MALRCHKTSLNIQKANWSGFELFGIKYVNLYQLANQVI